MHKLQKRFKKEITELAEASKRLSELGYVASHGGNLSYRVDKDIVLITPTKVAKRHVDFNSVCIINMAGDALYMKEGLKPTGETPLHTHVFEMRPDIKSIVHAHPPVLTGFAIAHSNELSKPILPEPIIELGPVLSTPYEEPLTDKLANAIDKVIDKTNAFLMENHGVTVLSYEGIERCLDLLEMLEGMAASIVVAKQLGQVAYIDEKEIKNLDSVCKTRSLPYPGKPGVFNSLVDAYK